MLFNNRSISANVTIGLMATVVVLVAALLMVQYLTQKRAGRMDIEEKADEYADGLATILAIPLWTLDTTNTEHIGSVYRQNELFASMDIRDNRGNSVFSYGTPPPPDMRIHRERDIVYDGETIGHLSFTLSLASHNRELNQLLAASLVTLATATLIILLATGMLLRIFMRKPLAEMAEAMEAVSRGNFAAPRPTARYVELANIMDSFREMAATIEARETALIQVNEALSKEVAERKNAEEARARSESTLKAIFNAAPVGIGLVHDRVISWPNAGLMAMTGYTQEELNNRSSEFLYTSPEEFQRVGGIIYKSMVEEETSTIEARWRTKRGEIIDVIISLSFIVPGDFDSGFVFTAMDITARKRAEAALRESEQRLHLALTGSNDGLWDWSIENGHVYYSPRFATMFGYEDNELPHDVEALTMVMHPEERDQAWAYVRQYVQGGIGEFLQEFRAVTKTGQTRWIMSRGMIAERDQRGRPTRMVGTHSDISDRKAAEDAREELINELEEKNAELERFTYTVSHDLKSPIITIKGFLGMMERDLAAGDEERIKTDMQRINQAADKMQQLLEELLELSRIGRLVNPPEDIDLSELVGEVVELVSGRLNKGNVRVEIEPDLPVVRGDRQRIQEVFLNIIDNAAKFMGEQPEPLITVGIRPGQDEWSADVIFVRDNGIGIKPEHRSKVFGLFDQLDPKREGTGIGLALVQRIVETHGGTIWVESDGPGTGSTFLFTLPGLPEQDHHRV